MIAGCASPPSAGSAMVRLSGAEIAILTNAGATTFTTAEVTNAFDALVQQCMEAQGFVYYYDQLTPAAFTSANLPGVPQAFIPLASRRANGYGFYEQAIQSSQPGSQSTGIGAEEKYADSLKGVQYTKYAAALQGHHRLTVTLPGGGTGSIPSGGCEGAAEKRLYGSAAGYVQATSGLSLLFDQLYNTVTSDPAFTAVTSKWSTCMARHDFNYKTPVDLWNSLNTRIDRHPTPVLQKLEIKVSVADYHCAQAVGLVATVERLQNMHAKYMSKALASDLAQVTQIDARALKIAKSLHISG
ncbi:MAG TPA: hypothetical protein VFQ44_05315 [Streptosporangiaceae bacterium]|nr:hypothetical protein [Streptosporangiaceae bacterium]